MRGDHDRGAAWAVLLTFQVLLLQLVAGQLQSPPFAVSPVDVRARTAVLSFSFAAGLSPASVQARCGLASEVSPLWTASSHVPYGASAVNLTASGLYAGAKHACRASVVAAAPTNATRVVFTTLVDPPAPSVALSYERLNQTHADAAWHMAGQFAYNASDSLIFVGGPAAPGLAWSFDPFVLAWTNASDISTSNCDFFVGDAAGGLHPGALFTGFGGARFFVARTGSSFSAPDPADPLLTASYPMNSCYWEWNGAQSCFDVNSVGTAPERIFRARRSTVDVLWNGTFYSAGGRVCTDATSGMFNLTASVM
eukprot:tig00001178_g7389.t1